MNIKFVCQFVSWSILLALVGRGVAFVLTSPEFFFVCSILKKPNMPKQTINPFRNFLCLLLFCLPRAHTVHHQLTDISRVQTAGLAKLSPMLLPASLLCRPCGAVAVVVIFNSCLREGTLFLSSSSFVCGGPVGRGCFLLVTPRGPQARWAYGGCCSVTLHRY